MCVSLNFILCGTGVIQRLEEEWSVSLLLGMDENCLWTLFTLETHYSTMNNWPYPYIQTSLRTSYSWSSFSLWLLWPKMFVSVQSAPLTSSTTERLNSSPHSQPAKQLAFLECPLRPCLPLHRGQKEEPERSYTFSAMLLTTRVSHLKPFNVTTKHPFKPLNFRFLLCLLCESIMSDNSRWVEKWKEEKKKKKFQVFFFFFTYKKMIVDDDDGICSMYPTFFLI